MRIDVRPRRKNAPRPAEKSATQFLQWLRGRECALAFMLNCEGKMEAAHVDFAGGKGMGTKVADRHALPLCGGHHREQHQKGWQTFLRTYGNFDPVAVAEAYWRAWPGRAAWEAKHG